MKTFNYKDQLYTCEIVHKNTNPFAKSKCVRIITQAGARNIYTIADGYTNPVAYDKNRIVLSDIVIGKAFAILGLMQNGKKFVFSNTTEPVTHTSSTIVTTNISSPNTMYRVVDINTGSIAMFSSETDVISYCIGRTVKIDKVEMATSITDTLIIPDTENTTPDIPVSATTVEEDNTPIPKRRTRTNYTTANPETVPDIPIESIEDKPTRRKRV